MDEEKSNPSNQGDEHKQDMDEETSNPSNQGDESVTSTTLDCPVCLQPCIQPVQLPCLHIFCYLCVKGLSQQNGACAMCRQSFPPHFLDNPKLMPHQNSSTVFDGSYQWFYEGRSGWWQYDERTSVFIEESYQSGERQCEIMIAGFMYTIDFEQNLQVRQDNAGRRRRIKRDVVTIPKKGVAGIRNTATDKDSSTSSLYNAASTKTLHITISFGDPSCS